MRIADDRLGTTLLRERSLGVPWKQLATRFRLPPGRLYRLWRTAQDAAGGIDCPNCGFHVVAERPGDARTPTRRMPRPRLRTPRNSSR